MCNPAVVAAAPYIMAVTTAATAAASVAQARQAQKLQIAQQEQQAEAAAINYNYAQKNLENEMVSQQDAAERELFNQNLEQAKARSALSAEAASSGISGNSLGTLSSDIDATFGRSIAETDLNFDIAQQQGQARSDADYRTLQSTLLGLSGEVQGPGFADSAIAIGGAAANGYVSGSNYASSQQKGYV